MFLKNGSFKVSFITDIESEIKNDLIKFQLQELYIVKGDGNDSH
jgi:hypothetical protein